MRGKSNAYISKLERRRISGENPLHIEWVKKVAIPKFKSWGYNVKILHDDRDYLDIFNHTIINSKTPGRNGLKTGFPLGGMCWINSRCKIAPIKRFFKNIKGDYIQYVGIAIDEPIRLKRLKGTKRRSLLARYGYTEQMARELCEEYDLLSPIYKYSSRGGCWFCPNSSMQEYAYIKQHFPKLWAELEKLSWDEDLSNQNFKYGESFAEINIKVDKYIERQRSKLDKED